MLTSERRSMRCPLFQYISGRKMTICIHLPLFESISKLWCCICPWSCLYIIDSFNALPRYTSTRLQLVLIETCMLSEIIGARLVPQAMGHLQVGQFWHRLWCNWVWATCSCVMLCVCAHNFASLWHTWQFAGCCRPIAICPKSVAWRPVCAFLQSLCVASFNADFHGQGWPGLPEVLWTKVSVPRLRT